MVIVLFVGGISAAIFLTRNLGHGQPVLSDAVAK